MFSTIKNNSSSLITFFAQLLLILTAFYEMLFSDAFFGPYLCILVLAVICLFLNYGSQFTLISDKTGIIFGFSVLFSLMMTCANYSLWESGGIVNIVLCIVNLIGSFCAWGNILLWVALNMDKLIWKTTFGIHHPVYIFWITFLIIAGINLTVLFLCKYPGNLSPDSIEQMMQLTNNVYSNHHPFWHTLTIKALVTIGYRVFSDINAAVAVFSCFSVLIMATVFAISAKTLAELSAPRWMIVLLVLFYAFMPYHIMYSMTMWKDVFYGAAILLFIVSFFRCITCMHGTKLNYVCFVLASVGVCLYRSNGFFVFVFSTLFFIMLWKGSNKKILFSMLGVIIGCFILKHPVLNALNVSQPDLVESLSIPVQQISRDVIENDDFTEEQLRILNEIVDVNEIPNAYASYISDPIKELIRERNNQNEIKQNLKKYVSLYFSRLLMHPSSYVKAWIDQTKGYWNSGYLYWYWANEVRPHKLGIERKVYSLKMNSLFDHYLYVFSNNYLLRIFLSIGFFDWLILIALCIGIIRHDKIVIMLTVPVIMNVVSLLIATPVFSEMRYNYCVFCSLPIILILSFRDRTNEVSA